MSGDAKHGEAGDAGIWERLWKTGALHSCAGAFRENYDGALAAFWTARFGALEDGAVVLDVGTGNGAIPLLAKDAARARGVAFRIHGADIADIDPVGSCPDGARRYEGIEFHPRAPLEKLPFADASVDLVCSQYAFEYARRDAALAEVVRVMGPRGQAGFVLHARASLVCSTALEQLEHCRFLLRESGLFAQARGLAQRLAATGPDGPARRVADHDTERLRVALNASAGEVQRRMAVTQTRDMLAKAMHIVSTVLAEAPRNPPEVTLPWFDRAVSGLADEERRLQALDAAALDEAGMAALREAFQARGCRDCDIGVLHHERGPLMGWTLVVANGPA